MGEAECRANISARNASCNDEVCEQCTSQCTYPQARAVAGVLRCTVAREQLGFAHCKLCASNPGVHTHLTNIHRFTIKGLQTSDAGQLARASHGAIRGDNFIAVSLASVRTLSLVTTHSCPLLPRYLSASPPTPTRSATSTPWATSNATVRCASQTAHLRTRLSLGGHPLCSAATLAGVSCRREHRNSPMGHFTPGFSTRTGNPVARSGYIVSCKRHSDCYSRCPAHPLTGAHMANTHPCAHAQR